LRQGGRLRPGRDADRPRSWAEVDAQLVAANLRTCVFTSVVARFAGVIDIGESWAYRAHGIDQLVELRVLRIGTGKSAAGGCSESSPTSSKYASAGCRPQSPSSPPDLQVQAASEFAGTPHTPQSARILTPVTSTDDESAGALSMRLQPSTGGCRRVVKTPQPHVRRYQVQHR
jgi:hypothetical protein